MYDMIPGVIGNKLKLTSKDLKLCGKEDLVINKICIDTSADFEKKFMSFLDQYVYQKYKVAAELEPRATLLRIGEPRIIERKVLVDYDNTWRSSGEKIFIALHSPHRNRYDAKGYIELNNFIVDPSVALLFKVEFRIEMPTADKKKKETAFFTLAWGYFLPTFNPNGEIQMESIDCDLKFGPGTAPDGALLWTPEKKDLKDFRLEINAELVPKGKFDPNAIEINVRKDAPPVRIEKELDKSMSLFNEDKLSGDHSAPKRNLKEEKKYQDELKRLKQERDQYKEQAFKKEIKSYNKDKAKDERSIRQQERDNLKSLDSRYTSDVEKLHSGYEKNLRKMQDQIDKLLEMNTKGQSGLRDSQLRDPRYQSPQPGQLPYSSNYLADPSYQHPSFYPPDDRSRLIGHTRYMDEDLKILPPPPQVPLELPTTFDLTRDDEIAFVKLGIKDEILRNDHDQPDLDIEIKNPLQASEFVFRFIAFKPPMSMPYGQVVPRRMYFKFNFFTFQETTSDPCTLKDPEGYTDMNRELIPGQQYLLEKFGKTEIREFRSVESEFLIDQTVSKLQDENIHFYKYLLERDVSIEVYDADSHLLYGTCCVNLSSMLKQTRSGVVRAKNCEIAAFDCSNQSITGAINMGHLQILMSHQGKKESEIHLSEKHLPEDNNNFFEDGRKQPSQKHKFNKRVKSKPIQGLYEEYVSNKPDDMYEKVIEEPYHIEDDETEELRKKMRIERVKKHKFKQKVLTDYEATMKSAHRPEEVINLVADPHKPEWLKKQSLKQIETLRDYTKPHIIEQVLKDHIKSMKHLYITPGTPSFFTYTLKNPFNSKTVFSLNIVDPDKVFLGETKEFKLINDIKFEWQFWHSKRKCEAPKYWDMVTKRNEVILHPGEECPLLFKYNTFREYHPHKNASELNIRERSIHLIFEYSSVKEGKGQMFETRIVVTPRKPPIDFSITFNEPPNSHASITIPANFYSDPFQSFCSDQNVICEFDAENRLTAELRTPDLEFNNPKSFLVYIYNDKFCHGLQCVLRIVIESVFCIYTKSRVGLRMEQTLTMQGDKARKVMLFSSNNRIIETTGQAQDIKPNSHNVLNVSVRTFERDYKKVRINCVDVNTRELVNSWLMLVESEEPKVTRTIDVNLIIDKGVYREVDFENKLNKEAIFEFASTRPDICKPKQSHIRVGPRMTKRVEFFFPPKRVKGRTECLIFVNDEEYNFYESYRFKLAYVA